MQINECFPVNYQTVYIFREFSNPSFINEEKKNKIEAILLELVDDGILFKSDRSRFLEKYLARDYRDMAFLLI